jgi:hypothetical protein
MIFCSGINTFKVSQRKPAYKTGAVYLPTQNMETTIRHPKNQQLGELWKSLLYYR